MPRSLSAFSPYVYLGIYILLIMFVFNQGMAMPAFGVDPSWMQALNLASHKHLVWGQDIIFTYGPWHMVASRVYDPQFYPVLLLSQAYIWIVFGWVFLKHYRTPLLYVLLLLYSLLPVWIDAIYTCIPLALLLLSLQPTRKATFLICALLLCSGCITLSKMSYFPAYLAVMLLADACRVIVYRKFPPFTLCVLISFVGFWILSGHNLAALPVFMRSIQPIISEYSEVMQANNPLYLAVVSYMVMAFNSGALAHMLFRLTGQHVFFLASTTPFREKAGSICMALAVLVCFYLVLRMGTTRLNSLHIVTPLLGSYLLMLMLFFYQEPAKISSAGVFFSGKKGSLFPAMVILSLVFGYWIGTEKSRFSNSIKSFCLTPSCLDKVYKDRWSELNVQALKALGDIDPASLKGTVTSYPWDITEFIALGMDYVPHPLLQTYVAFHPALQEKEADFLQRKNAPDHVFLKIKDADGRYPSLTASTTLLELFQRYRMQAETGLGLLLERRGTPLHKRELPVHERVVTNFFNQDIPLPPQDGRYIRMLAVDLEPSIAGKVLKKLFKMPIATIGVTTDGGTEEWRFTPPAARAGFVISPYMATTPDAARLFNSIEHSAPFTHNDVRTLRFHINPHFAWYYKKEATLRWWDVEFSRND